MTRREKTRDLFIELINHQLKPHGVTYEDVKENPNWYLEYTTSPEGEKEFINHCVDRIRQVLKVNKKQAEMETNWFILQWGLRTVETSENQTKTNTDKIKGKES